MNPLAIAGLGALAMAAVVAGVIGWGAERYRTGVNDGKRELAAQMRDAAASAAVARERDDAARHAGVAAAEFRHLERMRAIEAADHAKRAQDDRDRRAVVDRLHTDLLTSRATRPADSADAGGTCGKRAGEQRDLLVEGFGLLVEGAELAAEGASLGSEGGGHLERFRSLIELAREFDRSIRIGSDPLQ